MAGMQGPRVHGFSSASCVHAVESFDGGSGTPRWSAGCRKVVSSRELKRKVKKLMPPLLIQKWRRSRTARRGAAAADSVGVHDESDAETFVSANDSMRSSFGTDDDDDGDGNDWESSELSSFRLTPIIFPVGVLEYRPAASPVKVVHNLPFGYVIGRKMDAAANYSTPPPPSFATLVKRRFEKTAAMLADLHLRSRWRTVRNKLVRAPKERFRRGVRKQGRSDVGGSGEGNVDGYHDTFVDDDNGADGNDDDQDVFWKKGVRGLRCRRVEDDEPSY